METSVIKKSTEQHLVLNLAYRLSPDHQLQRQKQCIPRITAF